MLNAEPRAREGRRLPETLEGLTARQRALLVALLSAVSIMYTMPIGTRPLWNQDEARVVLLAEDTLRHGLRLPARVRDAPYLNKPPLFFWTVALGAWPTGRVSDREAPIRLDRRGAGNIARRVRHRAAPLRGPHRIHRARRAGHQSGLLLPQPRGLARHDVHRVADLGALLPPARAECPAAPSRASRGLLRLRRRRPVDQGASGPDGDPGNRRGLPRVGGHPAAALAAPVDGPGPRGADGAAVGNPLCPDAGAREQPDHRRESRRDLVLRPSPDPLVDPPRRRPRCVPAVGIVADPGRRVVAPLAGSPGLSTGAGLDARLRRPGGAERPAARALPAPRLSDPGAVRGRGGDGGRISRAGRDAARHHHPRRHARRGAGRGRMAPSREPDDLGDADRRLRLHRYVGARAPRGARRRRPRRCPPGDSGPPLTEPRTLLGRGRPGPRPALRGGHVFRPPGDDVPDPLVRRPRPPVSRPQRAAARVPRCEPGLRLLSRSSDRRGVRSSDDRRSSSEPGRRRIAPPRRRTGRTCVGPLIPAGAPSIG